MDKLTQLAIKYGTDKWGKHHYTPVYHEMFKDRRDDIKKLIEIGPAEGAGLFMFRDYFKNAIIVGLEVDHNRVDNLQEIGEPIATFQFDQGEVKDICSYIEEFESADIVIDDGSHNPIDQIFTFQAVMPYLKKGATYIIEDVAETDIIGILATRYYVEVKEVGNRYDDRLIICRK